MHPLGPAHPAESDPVASTGAGAAIWNEKRKLRAPGAPAAAAAAFERSAAVTETRSPATNWRTGANWVPRPPGCALRVPAWGPLREPTTRTETSWAGASAGKSMRVAGGASGVPGKGSTSRPPEASGRARWKLAARAGALVRAGRATAATEPVAATAASEASA